jgi:hypothetical protein
MILSVTVQPVTMEDAKIFTPEEKKAKLILKINLMDHPDNYVKLSYTEEGKFGNYNLAEAKVRSLYTHNRMC